jgi:hypothetical protein
MSAWSWPGSDVVRIVVAVVDADGAERLCCVDLHPGRDRAETVKMPGSDLTIYRPRRVRVDLGVHRVGRRAPQSRAQPTWRDDDNTVMWLRWLRARWRGNRHARDRRRRRKRGGTPK